MATVQGYIGKTEYPDASVLPNCPLTLGNGTGVATAGMIVKSGPFFGLLQDDAVTTDKRGLVVNQIMRIRKIIGAGHEIAIGDPLIFVASETGTDNDYHARVAVAGEAIHAYALEAADHDVTSVLIIGPYLPPFQIVGEGTADAIAAALAALVDGKAAGQILVCDGADGLAVTDFHVPLVDGNNGEILKQDAANSLAWAVDAT